MWSKKELIDKQAEFWVWMARGSTLIAACEAVGVDRRTGRHWRQATGCQRQVEVAPLLLDLGSFIGSVVELEVEILGLGRSRACGLALRGGEPRAWTVRHVATSFGA